MKFHLNLILVVMILLTGYLAKAAEHSNDGLTFQAMTLNSRMKDVRGYGESATNVRSKTITANSQSDYKKEIDLKTEIIIYFLICFVYGIIWYMNYLTVQKEAKGKRLT